MEDIKRQLIDYFIKKIEAIPSEEIGQGVLFEHCILWHCGMRVYHNGTAEAFALLELFKGHQVELNSDGYISWDAVYVVNDAGHGYTPKERLLNKLNSIK